MKGVAIVTGDTSGIGRCAAQQLYRDGYTVYGFSRREAAGDKIHHLSVDVTDEAAVSTAVSAIAAEQGRIDILVNAAGFGISGAVECTDTAEAKKLFDVNFFGMVTVNRAVLPIMHQQGSGRIVNVSSVAAPIAIPFQTYYSASKAAINTYTMALANEVRPYGITVCAVQPGDVSTGFTAARKKSVVGDELYGGRISRSVAVMEHDEQTGMQPETLGGYIARVAQKRSKKPIFTCGLQYKLFCVIVKLLPAGLTNYLVGRIYAK